MKKLLVGLSILSSMSILASESIQEGTYSNGKKGCELIVSTGDYFSTNVDRLIVEMDITPITRYGAILTQTIESSLEQLNESLNVELDNAAGIGSYIVAQVQFDDNGTVQSYKAQKVSPRGGAISEVISCDDLVLNN